MPIVQRFTELGKRIKTARNAKDWSQKDLADVLGCERQRIILWEKGRNRPNTFYRRKLRILLGVTDFTEDVEPMTDEEAGADMRTERRLEERTVA